MIKYLIHVCRYKVHSFCNKMYYFICVFRYIVHSFCNIIQYLIYVRSYRLDFLLSQFSISSGREFNICMEISKSVSFKVFDQVRIRFCRVGGIQFINSFIQIRLEVFSIWNQFIKILWPNQVTVLRRKVFFLGGGGRF